MNPELSDIDTEQEMTVQAWKDTIALLRVSTLRILEDRGIALEASLQKRLENDTTFWGVHSEILESLEESQPGISEAIFDYAELQSEKDRLQREEIMNRIVKKASFWKQLIFGRPQDIDLLAEYDAEVRSHGF